MSDKEFLDKVSRMVKNADETKKAYLLGCMTGLTANVSQQPETSETKAT